jgi:hypothetical protein
MTVKQVCGHSEMTPFRELCFGLHDLSLVALANQRNSTTKRVPGFCQRQRVDFSKPRVPKQYLHRRPNLTLKAIQRTQVNASFTKVVAAV